MSGASRWLDARNGLRHVPAATTTSTTQASFLTEYLLFALRRAVDIGCVNEGVRRVGRRKEIGGIRDSTRTYGIPTRYLSPVGAGTPPAGSRVTATATGGAMSAGVM